MRLDRSARKMASIAPFRCALSCVCPEPVLANHGYSERKLTKSAVFVVTSPQPGDGSAAVSVSVSAAAASVGGFFLWLQLPPPLLARDVVAAAEATHGVAAMVGERCSPTGPAGLLVQDRLRLCFAFLPVEELIEGQSVSQSQSFFLSFLRCIFQP